MDKEKIYEVYFYDASDESAHEHWYYHNEDNAEKKYRKLCKEYWVKPSFCFTDKNWYTIGYWEICFED